MKTIRIIVLLLVVVIYTGVCYDVDGGLLSRWRKRSDDQKRVDILPQDTEDFPFDEIPIINGEVCPDGTCPLVTPTEWVAPVPDVVAVTTKPLHVEPLATTVIQQMPASVTIQIERSDVRIFMAPESISR